MKQIIFLLLIVINTPPLFSQTIIDVQDKIFVCTGDSVILPRVRVVNTSCIDSSLINTCPNYLMILQPNCGCDQSQYYGPNTFDAGVTTSTAGVCPSQLTSWSGGNGGNFTTNFVMDALGVGANIVSYHPSNQDFINGFSNLIFTANGVSKTVKIIYSEGPNLGVDRLICGNLSNIPINAIVPGNYPSSINPPFLAPSGWSGGLGSFQPSNNVLNPLYTPTQAEINTGFVDLIFNDQKILGSCKSDTIRLFFNNSLSTTMTIDAGNDVNLCSGSSFSLNASGIGISSLNWSGLGSFSNSTSLNPSYYPSSEELQIGSGSIILNAVDINNCSKTDTLRFNLNSTVDILNDNPTDKKEIIICATNGSIINLNAIVKGLYNNVVWSTNGFGILSNSSNLSSSYTITNPDIITGKFTVYFQSIGCNNPTDSLTIKINNPSNIVASVGTLPSSVQCNQNINFPVNISGSYPWGNYCYGYSVSLDGDTIYNNLATLLYSTGPLSPGIHQILITEGGCNSIIGNYLINVPNNGIMAIQDTSVCEGQDVTLYGIGGSNYVWSGGVVDGIPFLPPGPGTYEYYLTGIDNCGLVGYDSVIVTVNPLSDTVISVSSIGNYTWPTNGQTYTQSGVYSAIIQNQYGCDSTITLNLTISTNSLNEIINSTAISVYPNPNNGSFFVKVPEYLIGNEYHLKSVNGSIVDSGWIKENNNEINVSKSLHFGMYILSIGSENVRLIIENK